MKPTVTALGINDKTCAVVVKVDEEGNIVSCGAPASASLVWNNLPPLYVCYECYEHGRHHDRKHYGEVLPTLEELREGK